jgi:hypothetical protein
MNSGFGFHALRYGDLAFAVDHHETIVELIGTGDPHGATQSGGDHPACLHTNQCFPGKIHFDAGISVFIPLHLQCGIKKDIL